MIECTERHEKDKKKRVQEKGDRKTRERQEKETF